MKLHWIKDPSVQFALIGALLFGVSSIFQSGSFASKEEIVISEARIRNISSIFERGWQRPPSDQELQRLIDEYVREEVLYREALNMGLDQNDAVIRRRLRTKMEFLAKDLVDAIEPSEQILQQFHQKNLQEYTSPAQYSFEQIFLDSDKRAEVAEDARIVLTRLTAGRDPRKLGDRSLLDYRFESVTPDRIDRVFGSDFSLQLVDLPTSEWTGPLTSAYGEHLVRITELVPEVQPAFTEIRDQILSDWQEAERKDVLHVQYQTLRDKYTVSIAPLSPAAESTSAESPITATDEPTAGEVARQ
ncbi:peptidylprolyl isomerase [Microbulbifer agarilyticus]|uniref:peptidylprolyl isomerase n=1 Tax=Microbulbifer agarilyticus TaxID=260552 RepID=UPI001C98DD2A|nr:peptidylprolyl isomerase [Microbulbifer agarilyticus]MBY6212499.1 peptidyl-prolyl cis-trans isomerase [Microbulbifer agarilyticus]MCA0894115.1 peptidyl-prolyl cis-trans isomerase [Microbulbifer agarilyticus]